MLYLVQSIQVDCFIQPFIRTGKVYKKYEAQLEIFLVKSFTQQKRKCVANIEKRVVGLSTFQKRKYETP